MEVNSWLSKAASWRRAALTRSSDVQPLRPYHLNAGTMSPVVLYFGQDGPFVDLRRQPQQTARGSEIAVSDRCQAHSAHTAALTCRHFPAMLAGWQNMCSTLTERMF
jgi:hypothetical protein